MGLAGVGAAAAVASAATGVGSALARSGAVSGSQGTQANASNRTGRPDCDQPAQPLDCDGCAGERAAGQNLLGLNGQPAADAAMTTFQKYARLSVAFPARAYGRRTPEPRPWAMLAPERR